MNPSASRGQRDVIRVTMLGGFSLCAGGQRISDESGRSQKFWNVLCYLIANRERSVTQSELIELFWPDDRSSNPISALKTLLSRIRSVLDPLFPNQLSPILSQRGSYAWNPALAVEVDAEQFEALWEQLQTQSLDVHTRIALYREMLALYQGDFLSAYGGNLWVIPLSARYHNIYVSAVKEFAALLESRGAFGEMTELCSRASTLDNLDESLHVLVIRGLVGQGKEAAALERYEQVCDLLYRSLGVTPSEELRALYAQIMDTEKSFETDLAVIQRDLRETASRPGAFVCEFGFFREIYRLESRRAERSGACVHIGLITVTQANNTAPPLKALNYTMDRLLQVMVDCLRRGDVVSRYSAAQYVLMLPSANFEDATMVMERILSAFHRQYRRSTLKLSYRVRELEQTQEEHAP